MGEILEHEVSGTGAVSRDAWTARFQRELEGLGIPFDLQAPARLARYHELLTDWNTRMNLTGDTAFETALYRHYMDSVAPLQRSELFPANASLIDVGSGAGFPGLPLAIVRPDLKVTLLDSLQKRLHFLSAVVEALGLTNVRLCHDRAEDGGQDKALRESFDIAVARAVASLPVLLEYLVPFVRVGGKALCYKGPAADAEWAAGNAAAQALGCGRLIRYPIVLPGQPEWEHCVMAAEKTEKTLRQYPRKAGTPERKPLG